MPRKILIVDDNRIDRAILRAMLEKEYNIVEAENEKEAYALLLKNPYAFSTVIVDVIMPAMNGYELVERIRQNILMAQIPIIMATSDNDNESLTKALTCGANNFISKPFNSSLLFAMVKNNVTLRETAALINELQRDKLTGILNRDAFMKEAARLIRRHEEGYYIMASFDVNHFKVINDQYGPHMGDKVLKYLASVFQSGFADFGGICCRISDDRFAVMYPAEYKDSALLENIRRQASQIEGLSSPLSFSVGRYLVSDLSLSPGIMYDRAVLAGETVKNNYGNAVAYYDENMRATLLYEQYIVGDMERALSEGEFEPWFQPQYDHATGELIGAEALVRWIKNGNIIPPNDFIDVFEKNGFIYQVDQYMWRQVCEKIRRWLDEGRSPMPVSVNISRYDLFQNDFLDVICGVVEEYNLPVELLRLEITESAFTESPQQIVAVVTNLVEFGFMVEIDDFGSGYSSLNTLKDVPAQILKMDMRFLEAGNSQRGRIIIESIVHMAKWLGMSVIAEGVETLQQANYLCSIGCNYIQGYFYAKPMPSDRYELHCREFK